ncbi:DNA-processing protein DprA [Thalassomonas sp. M1454]|uniref:DNA-processing protein DprA n=1 Tax=Thalassomonas sp. M1454 TaxID=2594477 RepID=UPI00117E009C|nr:DNA-processing protein DprA [Thalassomonas sp. M1454]TRX58153.1 DNA-protecting protein DprA [Thalassomonas sp. M1454]
MSDITKQKYWLALKLIPRLANAIKYKLVNQHSIEGLFNLSQEQLALSGLNHTQQQAIVKPNWQKINHIIEQCQQFDIAIINITQANYPSLLKQTHNPPNVLFYQGNADLFNQPQIAIVGSRAASISAQEHAKSFASKLSASGVVVTSGLAIGIDSCAHRGALNVQGKTIAVVATGLDQVYPKRHKALASEILNTNGLIVSEYIPGSPPNPGCFPKRNTIITGMSLGTFVVEATIKSGSLISARSALEQNREVFAMPGAINNPQTKGCHYLIKQGATLVDEVDDILSVLDLQGLSGLDKREQKNSKNNHQQDLFIDELLSSVDYETTSVDTVVSRSQLPTEEVLTRLLTLELRGLVTAVPGGYIKLN